MKPSLKMMILPPEFQEEWPEKIQAVIPGSVVKIFRSLDEIDDHFLAEADCAFGYLPPEIFSRAKKLRWIQCYAAGPDPSFWHEALVNSDVVVTNFRGIYNELVAAHAMMFVLAISTDYHTYALQKERREWRRSERPEIFLPGKTALIVGMGGIGKELAQLCRALGMKVIGIDAKPSDDKDVHPPKDLDALLPRADFVIIAVPETPETRRMFDFRRITLMKESAYLINVGRGVVVVLDDLVRALDSNKIAGAALDVFEREPLPTMSPLWSNPRVIITPHVAAPSDAPQVPERRTEILIENCRRFMKGEELVNVVDKKKWF